MKSTSSWLPVAAAAILAVGCMGKRPAEKAVADIETSINALRADAQQLAPAELQQAESALASLQDSLSRKEYKTVIEAAPAVSTQVASLQQTVSAKKTEMEKATAAATQQWQTLSTEVPQMLEAIRSRLDMLSQSRQLPKNVSKDALQSAKDGLEEMKRGWDEATALFGVGKAVDAVSKGQMVKEKGNEVMQSLAMEA